MILEDKGHRPKIGNNVFIALTAVVIGKVQIGDDAGIRYGIVIRGDRGTITIGRNVNIQDNCTLRTDPGQPVVIGDGVSVGHAAVVHGCTSESNSLVGIRAVVLNGAVIKKGSVVESGAGVPAVFKKTLDQTVLEKIGGTCQAYQNLAKEHIHMNAGSSRNPEI